jgi:hypothetical protein
MALESTQPLTEMCTRNITGGKWRPALNADNLDAILDLIVWKMGELQCLTILLASAVSHRDSFTLPLKIK